MLGGQLTLSGDRVERSQLAVSFRQVGFDRKDLVERVDSLGELLLVNLVEGCEPVAIEPGLNCHDLVQLFARCRRGIQPQSFTQGADRRHEPVFAA